MALLNDKMTTRLLNINAAGKVAVAWFSFGGAIESTAWAAQLDGTVACEVEGTMTYFDPAQILAVREKPA